MKTRVLPLRQPLWLRSPADIATAIVLLAATASWTARPAQAVEYNAVSLPQSSVTFTAKQMGVAVDGKFDRFTAQIAFDPAQPLVAKASIDIDLASIDAGSAEASDEAAGKLWFNTKVFPTAKFVSTSVKALGGNRYEVAGKLTIKGKTRDITAPFSVTQKGSQAIFDGSFVIKRADFSIGEGMWADFGTVANEIPVRFRIVANAASATAARK